MTKFKTPKRIILIMNDECVRSRLIGWLDGWISAFSRQVGIRRDRSVFVCASLDFAVTGPSSSR